MRCAEMDLSAPSVESPMSGSASEAKALGR